MPILCRELIVQDSRPLLLSGQFVLMAVLCLLAHFVLGLFGCLSKDILVNRFTKLYSSLNHCKEAVLSSIIAVYKSVDLFSELVPFVQCSLL